MFLSLSSCRYLLLLGAMCLLLSWPVAARQAAPGPSPAARPVSGQQGPILLVGEALEQDGKLIGRAAQTDVATGGQLVRVVRFTAPDGTFVAEATFLGSDATSCTLVTIPDHKPHALPVAATAPDAAIRIAAFLVRQKYL